MNRTDHDKKRKALLIVSLVSNLGILGYFKYVNFFTESFRDAFTLFGQAPDIPLLDIILPVGISFYTFQTLSYTIDIYRNKLEPAKDVISFFAFVSFFPQLVAGPIERAIHLLPQFYHPRKFNYDLAKDGMRRILWGLFKKVVVADGCAVFVNEIFGQHETYGGSTLLLGAVFFAFQIYGDFSGYSDMAIGFSRLMGFDLMKNFAYPYFSRDIAEFWRRWHISLSTWFRDYLYIPLGGSRVNQGKAIRNIFIIFIVSGFWHGANWTFIIWGALNAVYFLPLMLLNKNRSNLGVVAEGNWFPGVGDSLRILSTFGLTVLAWVFFRAESVTHAMSFLGGMLSLSLFSVPAYLPAGPLIAISVLLLVEWMNRGREHGLDIEKVSLPTGVRWAGYVLLFLAVMNGFQANQEFIYFQF
ncbi:MBOAT family protein [Roseivirga sp. BDSF3-8]|uniref:MBOAT family O-acyltransferase n=1 Tax=Roseivirga sp. BDSF3-8 TaxID=3241598 RepID=UPI003531847C